MDDPFSPGARAKSIDTRKRISRERALRLKYWFWDHVNKSETCWEWQGHCSKGGYGVVSFSGKQILAHRASYEMNFGPIPTGHFVCHRCDNPKCVRPDHLFLGAPVDNVRDMLSKGRNKCNPPMGQDHWARKNPEKVRRGSANNKAKLTEKQVAEIREKYASGKYTQTQLSGEYQISQQVISKVINKKLWSHVP